MHQPELDVIERVLREAEKKRFRASLGCVSSKVRTPQRHLKFVLIFDAERRPVGVSGHDPAPHSQNVP